MRSNKRILKHINTVFDKKINDTNLSDFLTDASPDYGNGHHETAEILFNDFGKHLSQNSKKLLLGLPCLVCPKTNHIIGIAMGMYAPLLKFTPFNYLPAQFSGCKRYLKNLDGVYAQSIGGWWLYSWSFIEEVPAFIKQSFDYYNK